MTYSINTFINDESGAVTVDWVVLTAALVGLGLAVMSVVAGGVGDVSQNIGDQLTSDHVGNTKDLFDAGAAAAAAAGGGESGEETPPT